MRGPRQRVICIGAFLRRNAKRVDILDIKGAFSFKFRDCERKSPTADNGLIFMVAFCRRANARARVDLRVLAVDRADVDVRRHAETRKSTDRFC